MLEKYEEDIKEVIRKWVNLRSKCDMEFTALHYASFEGNRELIGLLIEWGADPSIKGKNGISVMHVAA
jgi:ankyrin repeat protein